MRLHVKDIGSYYAFLFIQRVEILAPFALLLATIKTLCQLNVRNELIALMSSGMKLKRLMRPFIYFGMICVAFMYVNLEYLQPWAITHIKKFEEYRFLQKHKNELKNNLKSLTLADGSVLLFHRVDDVTNSFYDVFWIKSIDHIYRMKQFFPFYDTPKGSYVDELKRDQMGEIALVNSYTEKNFPEIKLDSDSLKETIIQPNQFSLSKLVQTLQSQSSSVINKPSIETVFYFKMLIPWLCLLAVLGPAPFCLRFTRQLPIFFIYLGGVLAVVVFYLIINASVILGENDVIAPLIAIGVPFAFVGLLLGYNYARNV
jgi:lipopolysaccharide export system permease protein